MAAHPCFAGEIFKNPTNKDGQVPTPLTLNLPPIMNSPISQNDRIKLHEVVAATALVAFVAVTLTATAAALTTRLYVVELLDHIKPKGKGVRRVP